MLFVRTDIFAELGIEPPKTWDEFIDCAKIINLNNMNCGMPQIYSTFMTQMDVPLYKEDLSATNLMSAGSVNAFTYWTDFYTKYGFPKTYDFFNRFRTGLMPMGIADFSVYATIKAAAPEINGKWMMYELPGFQQEDGSINNTVTGNGSACVILNWSKTQDKAWEFLKWWTSDDIQYRFGVNLESVLGMSGRYETANLNALYRLGWEAENLAALKAQGKKLQQLPEVPGGYYVGRSTQQVYWNVVNNGEKVEDMLKKWVPEADDEIRRKTEEYARG
jgi:ABC-type glycerol-3-phosphate transport system substrate-binding protein